VARLKASEKAMINLLLGISVELSQCQYGNYVMQHIVSHAREYQSSIEDTFLNNFIKLSTNKYASNVIEKVIKLSSQDYRDKLAKNLAESERYIEAYLVWSRWPNISTATT
jgi:pumilio RNA-binding family